MHFQNTGDMLTEAEKKYAQDKLGFIRDSIDNKDLDRHHVWKDANHYRTTYKDLCDGMESAVKSDFPSGYGGHIPSTRHDILHRGSDFDTVLKERINENRDYIKPFYDLKIGQPTFTDNPLAKREHPRYGTIPLVNDLIVPPYAILKPLRPPPCYRNAEATCDALEHGQTTSVTYKPVGHSVTSKLPDPSPPRFLRNSDGTFYGKTTRDCVPVNDQTVIVNGHPFDRAEVTAVRQKGLDPSKVLTIPAAKNPGARGGLNESGNLIEDTFVQQVREKAGEADLKQGRPFSEGGETHKLLQDAEERSPLSAAGYSTIHSRTGPLPLNTPEHAYGTGPFAPDQFDAAKATRGPAHSHLSNVTSNYTSTFVVNEKAVRR